MRALTAALVASAVLALSPSAFASTVTEDAPRWIPKRVRLLAVCESRGNPRHRAGSYGGLVSWYIGTWRLDRYPGMPLYPRNATLAQQVRVALRSLERGRYFGCRNYSWVRAAG